MRLFSDSSLSSVQVTVSMPPPPHPLIPIWSSCTKCLLKHLFGRSFVVYMLKILPVFKDAVLFPAVLQIKSQLAADNLQAELRFRLLTLRFMHFVFSRCLLVSRPAYHVVICDCKLDVITHLQMKHICALAKECFFFFLVAMVMMSCLTSKVTPVQGVFGWLEQLTYSQLCSCSHEHRQLCPSPCPWAQKKLHCAGRERGKRGLVLVTALCFTFLQGLHLELVSCSGCTG